MPGSITIAVRQGDALHTACDALIVTYARPHRPGVDAAVAAALSSGEGGEEPVMPMPGEFQARRSGNAVAAPSVVLVGVVEEPLQFDYAAIRNFAQRGLSAVKRAVPKARAVVFTTQGTSYGLDESEAFRAELAGIVDALDTRDCPPELETVVVVEPDAGRAQRLQSVLTAVVPSGHLLHNEDPNALTPTTARESLANVGEGSRRKRHIFVAMPFGAEFEDRDIYGIQRAAQAAGFLCERADMTSFVGGALEWIRTRIDTASFVVADLTTTNANVYLEVGYAWGRGVPTILVVSEAKELGFDVRSQRCLPYAGSIKQLEDLLTKEIRALSERSE